MTLLGAIQLLSKEKIDVEITDIITDGRRIYKINGGRTITDTRGIISLAESYKNSGAEFWSQQCYH